MKFHALMSALVFGAVGFAGGPAHALPSPVLPGPISYEYFGLNFFNNVVTSNTVGTLNYTDIQLQCQRVRVDGDRVAFMDQRDVSARVRFGRHVADHHAPGAAREEIGRAHV